MNDKTRAHAPEKILRCALALLLAAATLLAGAAPALAQAGEPAYESGRGVTFAERLGFDPEAFVANLEAHKDRYLGTPYTMDDREAGPGAGMDCSTFVSYALINEAGVADSTLRHDMRPRHADENCLPNTETLYTWAFANCDVRVFSSKEDLLASRPAKGDILFVWEKSSGDVPLGGAASHVGIYWGEGNGEDLMFHATPPACTIGPIKGKVVGDLYYASVAVSHGFDLTVDKSAGDAIALDTEGNGAYAASLEGARYGVYADEACTEEVAAITVAASGSGFTGTAEGLDPGTYWVKETRAPEGYALDPTVQRVELDGDKSVSSAEDKQYFPIGVSVVKLARDGQAAPEGDASFEGAKFRIDYPNGKSGVYRTGPDGRVSMRVDDGCFVEGDPLDVVDGSYVLQLGTYAVTEVEAPQGCVIPEDATQTIEVTATDQLSPTSTQATFSNAFEGSLGYVQTPALGGVAVAKGDALLFDEDGTGGDGSYHNYAQGDASLAGAEFTVYNASAGRVCVDLDADGAIGDGESIAPGDPVVTIATEYDADLDAYVARTADRLLPYGTYLVRETKAPEGYTPEGAIEKQFQVRGDGEVSEFLLEEGELNEVAAGGVRVVKSDAELGASEAIGGNGHTPDGAGTTLAGIELTITNASEHGVMVGGEWFHAGDEVMTIETAWDEEAGAYTAQTAPDALPYGTYTIQETATNDSYLLTDGEPRTFEVREDGAVVTADAEGGALELRDQVVRNDLKLSKKADDTNESLQVPFAITNTATGETHVLVTDCNGQASTEAGWNKHTENTNGNDGLLEAEAITSDMMDPEAGIWFGLGEDGSAAPADDGLGALPFGEYTLEELPCEANEGYELVTKTFWVERDSGVAEEVWMTLDDQEGPKIGTTASDASDGDQVAQAAEKATVADTVHYENLEFGGTYTLTGTLMVKSTGEPLLDAEGSPVTATKEFTAENTNGSVDVEFTFDASLLAGEDVVAFESLSKDGVEVAVHADIEDSGQTVRFVGIGTTASDAADGDKLVTGPEVAVADEVSFKGLTPGEGYALEATLMDAETGEPVKGADGDPVTATAEFAPEAPEGAQTVELSLDSAGLGGHRLVVFERLLDAQGTVLAVHEDIEDEGQSVTVVEIGTTLVDSADGDHTVENGTARLVDTVEYKGLVAGEAYTAHGTVMDKATGMPLEDAEDNPVTATAEFTPEASDGAVEVAFEFDASKVEEGAALVAFEEVLDASGNVVAVHQDIDDEGQTVVVDNPETPSVPESPYAKTGADAPSGVDPLVAGAVALVAVASVGGAALAIRSRARAARGRNGDAE